MRQLDDQALGHVAQYFAALAAPMRLKILNALRDGERNVGELTALTGCTQANVSKHLGVLTQHGLVQRDPRGTSAYYRIADPGTYELCDIVCGQIGKRIAVEAGVRRMLSAAAGNQKKPGRRKAARKVA